MNEATSPELLVCQGEWGGMLDNGPCGWSGSRTNLKRGCCPICNGHVVPAAQARLKPLPKPTRPL